MKEFFFKKIDAFATPTSDGNPAGCIRLSAMEEISSDEMLRIAKELRGFVSEVGYICRQNEDTFILRYYSAEREVEFCGHATIAIMYDILKNSTELIHRPKVKIVTNRGVLVVENHIVPQDAVFIMAPEPVFHSEKPTQDEIVQALHVERNVIGDPNMISVVNAGLQTLIVPIRTLKDILSINPDVVSLKAFCLNHAIDIIEVFCDEVYSPQSAFRTRVFAPTFGYLEDPATGSGNSAFGYHLLANKRWDGEPMIIEQNGNLQRHNVVRLKTDMDERNRQRVFFGGAAITRIEGKYHLSSSQ